MIWLLSLFSAYRRVVAMLDDERRARALAEDQRDAVQEQVGWLRKQVEQAQQAERNALQMTINFSMQRQYGVAPYPEAPKLPDRLTTIQDATPIESDVVRPEIAQRRQIDKFREQFSERLEKARGKTPRVA